MQVSHDYRKMVAIFGSALFLKRLAGDELPAPQGEALRYFLARDTEIEKNRRPKHRILK